MPQNHVFWRAGSSSKLFCGFLAQEHILRGLSGFLVHAPDTSPCWLGSWMSGLSLLGRTSVRLRRTFPPPTSHSPPPTPPPSLPFPLPSLPRQNNNNPHPTRPDPTRPNPTHACNHLDHLSYPCMRSGLFWFSPSPLLVCPKERRPSEVVVQSEKAWLFFFSRVTRSHGSSSRFDWRNVFSSRVREISILKESSAVGVGGT